MIFLHVVSLLGWQILTGFQMPKWRPAATTVQITTHTTPDSIKDGVQEDGPRKLDEVPEQTGFKLIWLQFDLCVE